MSYGSPDVYYQPEHFKLTQVGMISDPEADWSFDDFVVWQHEDGRLFYASDAGCSCPSPFESYTSLGDLTPITDSTYDQFYSDLMKHSNDSWRSDGKEKNDRYPDFKANKVELASKVLRLLRNNPKQGASFV